MSLQVAGLFAGIGGFELGFERAGMNGALLVENSPAARAVLERRFPNVELESDVRNVRRLPPNIDVVAAGFPCQDLSSVGKKFGIDGARSSLVGEVFRLLRRKRVEWVVLENVPFILQLAGGAALTLISEHFAELGYSWAYRVIDTQNLGVPQRRRRWFFVASRHHDPRDVILSGDVGPRVAEPMGDLACGFYWTEGMRALGWAVDATPPIKGGSTVGVPSPPAILLPSGEVVLPNIRDAERLQGFEADWTAPAEDVVRQGFRWQLIGNAVSVCASEWVGRKLIQPMKYDARNDLRMATSRWPYAAWCMRGKARQVFASLASDAPVRAPRAHLADFLEFDPKPLSARATLGFLHRADKGSLRFPENFIDRLRAHASRQVALELQRAHGGQ